MRVSPFSLGPTRILSGGFSALAIPDPGVLRRYPTLLNVPGSQYPEIVQDQPAGGRQPFGDGLVDQSVGLATSRSVDLAAGERSFERPRIGPGRSFRQSPLNAAAVTECNSDLISVASLADGHGISCCCAR